MSDRVPAELLLDIFPCNKRNELDQLLFTSRRLKRLVMTKSDSLPRRDVTLWMDSPVHGFRISETGQCRHTRNCRIYQLLRMVQGCFVRKLTIMDGMHPWHGQPFTRQAFLWLSAVLRHNSSHFKDSVVCLYPHTPVRYPYEKLLPAFAQCAEFHLSCTLLWRPGLGMILNHIPIDRCREVDVSNITGVDLDAIIAWLTAPVAGIRLLTVGDLSAHGAALVNRLVERRAEFRQLKVNGTRPYREVRFRLFLSGMMNPHFGYIVRNHLGLFHDRSYTYDGSSATDYPERIVVKISNNIATLNVIVCGKPTMLSLD